MVKIHFSSLFCESLGSESFQVIQQYHREVVNPPYFHFSRFCIIDGLCFQQWWLQAFTMAYSITRPYMLHSQLKIRGVTYTSNISLTPMHALLILFDVILILLKLNDFCRQSEARGPEGCPKGQIGAKGAQRGYIEQAMPNQKKHITCISFGKVLQLC